MTAAVVQYPDVMERVLLHAICFIGSLLALHDSILPKKSFLKFFIRAVQAKRDYDVKHGLVRHSPGLPPPGALLANQDHAPHNARRGICQISIEDQTLF